MSLPLLSYAQEPIPIPVVASFSILADLVQVVGGDRVQVEALVGPNADAHTFSPAPGDARKILQSRLLVLNGLNFEPWAEKLAQSTGYLGPILVASTGVTPRTMAAEDDHDHSHLAADPHAWQDPTHVILYVKNIAQALAKIDPQGASTYKQRSQDYIVKLQALDAFAKEQFAVLSPRQRRVITSHDAFGYFGARYQIRFLAPVGWSTESQPSAKKVAQLIRQIKTEKIRAVFVENMNNPKLLQQIARDTGVTLGPKLYVDALSTPEQGAGTYLDLMHYNIKQLTAGMKLN